MGKIPNTAGDLTPCLPGVIERCERPPLPALEAGLVASPAGPPRRRPDPPAADASRAAWAAYYKTLGIVPCAIPPGRKGPIETGWTEQALSPEHWWERPEDGIGAVLGPSRLVSLDLDALPEARAVLAELGLDLDQLTACACLIRGNPARLRALFRAPTDVVLSRRALTWPAREKGGKPVTVFELRAGPVQDVLPPTIHPETGKPYEWVRAPWELDHLGELPPELLELWQGWDAWRPALEAMCPWAKRRGAQAPGAGGPARAIRHRRLEPRPRHRRAAGGTRLPPKGDGVSSRRHPAAACRGRSSCPTPDGSSRTTPPTRWPMATRMTPSMCSPSWSTRARCAQPLKRRRSSWG